MYTITDSTGDSASAAVTVAVTGAPDVIIGDASVEEGNNLVFDVDLTHPYGEDLNLTLTLIDDTAVEGEDYIPATLTVLILAGSTHVTAIVASIDDAVVEGDEYLNITITAVNSGSVGDTSDTGRGTIIDNDTPPVIENDDKNATFAEPVIIDVVGNDDDGTSPVDPSTVQIIDPDNGEVTHYVVPGEGTWGVNTTTGEITFTPEPGFIGDPAPIEYTVYDVDGNSGTGIVTINYMPVANDDMNNPASEGETVIIDILANDRNTSSPLDPMSVNLIAPDNATDIVTDNEGDVVGFTVTGEGEWSVDEDSGVVTFVPDEDLEGDPTPVEYTVKEENGDESNRAIIEVLYEVNTPVLPPVDPSAPIATDNLDISITHYGPAVIDVLANGDTWGSNGPGTQVFIFTQPTYGTVALDDGGTPNDPTDDVLIYTPAADVNNIVDRFTYTITDAAGNTSTASVTLNVKCASSQTSDSGNALGTLSIIIMMLFSVMSGLYFVRKEEEIGEI